MLTEPISACLPDGIKVSHIWTRNGGQPLPERHSTTPLDAAGSQLSIRTVNKNDGGTYECVATDFFGTTVTAVGTLIVECESNNNYTALINSYIIIIGGQYWLVILTGFVFRWEAGRTVS